MTTNLIRFTDVTSLRECDTPNSITEFVASTLHATGGVMPASFCVFPSMIESAALASAGQNVALTAVCGAFPSGQTYIEVKLLEVAMAIENGADEIDCVIDIGAVMEGQMELAEAEIEAIVEEIGGDALLKVILETGVLCDEQLIYDASMMAMQAGVDFIKTSTGKTAVGATVEAARVMCRAIAAYAELTGRQVGFKAAGGIRTDEQAMEYYNIVSEILGERWLTPALFRIGRSSI